MRYGCVCEAEGRGWRTVARITLIDYCSLPLSLMARLIVLNALSFMWNCLPSVLGPIDAGDDIIGLSHTSRPAVGRIHTRMLLAPHLQHTFERADHRRSVANRCIRTKYLRRRKGFRAEADMNMQQRETYRMEARRFMSHHALPVQECI